MTRYGLTLGKTWTRPNDGGSLGRWPSGGLGDGYYVTLKPGLRVLELWNIQDPTTALDSYSASITTVFRNRARNSSGELYLRRDTATSSIKMLTRVTQSSGVMSVTDIGTFTAGVSATGLLHLTPDGTEVAFWQSTPRRIMGVSTAAAATNYDILWSGSGHNPVLLCAPAVDRFIAYCDTHLEYELWEGTTQTLLDSMADNTGRASNVYPSCTDTHRTMWASLISDEVFEVGCLDTSGDTFAWAWGRNVLSTPGWLTLDMLIETRGYLASLAPEASIDSPYPAVSMYVCDTRTGQIGSSPSSTLIGAGATFTRSVGAIWVNDDTVVIGPEDSDTDTWSSWVAYPQAATLRQRQSPRRSPSRVGYPALRQRQSPFIR